MFIFAKPANYLSRKHYKVGLARKILLLFLFLTFNRLLPTPEQKILPDVTINFFSCITYKLLTDVLALLKPHVETSPDLNAFGLLRRIFDSNYQLQCISENNQLDAHLLTQATSLISAFIQKLAIFEIPTPTQVVDTEPLSS